MNSINDNINVSFYIKDESALRRCGSILQRISGNNTKLYPCFRVYRNDGACMATYVDEKDAHKYCAEMNLANTTYAEYNKELSDND